jgi:outer membrane receptor protein involved in Fe transport
MVATCLIAAATAVAADGASAQAQQGFRFNLRGMSLDAALRRYARITGRQIIYRSETVATRPAPSLVGTYSADDALNLLLEGAALRVQQVRPGVLVLTPAEGGKAPPVEQATGADGEDAAEEVVVTGTIIRGRQPAGAMVTTIDRRAIDRSVRSSVADVVALLPQNSGATGNDAATLGGIDRTSLNSSLASSPNLRGLGSDATLTLVNGRRQAGSGGRGDFTDLSTVPLAAVDRIEILADGASAIYGSDAVGGVVNVILKRDYEGLDLRLRSGVGSGAEPANQQAGLLAGMRWSGGGVLAAYEYDRRGRLPSAARERTRSSDLRRLGGDDWRSYFSSPGTILRLDPVARAFVPAFAIPPQTDRPSRTDFTPGRNLENQFALTDTLPLQERHSVFVRGTQALLEGVEVFGEARWAQRGFEYALPPSTATFAVTPANPFFVSPDGAPFSVVAYSFGDDLGPIRSDGTVEAVSLTGGVTAGLGLGWQVDAYYLQSRENTDERTRNLVNTTALAEALGSAADNPQTSFSAVRDGFFNPYGSGSSNRQAVLAFIGSGSSGSWRRSSLSTAVVKLDGPLFALPGGTVRAAVGGAWRREALRSGGFLFDSGIAARDVPGRSASREIEAAFAEVSVPVFDAEQGFGIGRLDVAAALRHERYSDFGTTTNPKVGATWRVSGGLEVRASWGTSFRAPSLPEIYAPFQVAPTQLPTAAGTNTAVLFMSGGNLDLRPETAETISGGVTFRPLADSKLSLGYFRTSFDDRIDRPALQSVLRALVDPVFSPFVARVDPTTNAADLTRVQALLARPEAVDPGALPPTSYRAIVDGRYVNTSTLLVEGLDVSAAAETRLGAGSLSASVDASIVLRYSQRLTPVAPLVPLVSTVGNPPRLKARATLDWTAATFGVTAASSMVGAYSDQDRVPASPVSAWVTFDLQLRAIPKRRGMSVALDVRNLFDRPPPFVNRTGGIAYDPANADVLGRTFAVQVTRTW